MAIPAHAFDTCHQLAARLASADGFRNVTVTKSAYVAAEVRLDRIIARDDDVREVMASGRVSDTPDAPILLCARDDDPLRFELSDGHHRITRRISQGETWVRSVIDPMCDDEPLEGPWYDFAQHLTMEAAS